LIAASKDEASRERVALLCRQGELRIALPLSFVVETMRPMPVRRLAGLPSFVLGVSVVRGAAVPVVDAGACIGARGPEDAAEPPARWVSVRSGSRSVVVAVSAVEGFASLAPAGAAARSPLLGALAASVIAEIAAADRELLVLLQAASILSDAEWQVFDGRGDE
jgi:purine-binding chemotaxis protein CheW